MGKIQRRTKIIATLGPATDSEGVLDRMIKAGVDLVRMNFSHGSADDHIKRAEKVRALAKAAGREVGILADLQGPKIRVAQFIEGKITLESGAEFILDSAMATDAGTIKSVGIDYKELPKDVSEGDTLLLDDGLISLKVTSVSGTKIICTVIDGGILSNNKGINRKGGGLSAPALTDKDKEDLKTAVGLGADYIAVSFPRDEQDILFAKELVREANGKAGIMAKIERTEAVANIDDIIRASDAVMVARGDLGVEIGDAELPSVQKHIIHQARALDKAVVTATQMMESMIHKSMPTRAEVFDVANAVLDGTDAVMLSAETAAGAHPDKVVEAMSRICLGAEENRRTQVSKHRLECQFTHVDEAIAMATMYTANHMNIAAIISLTESGSTPLWMSRIRSGIPIYGLTRHIAAQRRMSLYRGVYTVDFDVTKVERHEVNEKAIEELKSRDIITSGDFVIITKGDYMGVHGGTNTMKIFRVN